MSLGRLIVMWGLATVGLLCLWFFVFALVLSPLAQSRQQTVNYSIARETLALQTAPLGGSIAPGTPVAVLSAPALGLDDVVVSEGTASGDLMAGPGHRRDTVLPAQTGVSVVYGRARMFGGPFGLISQAAVGSQIHATTAQGEFNFRVIDVRRAGDPLPPALALGHGRLTLVTAAEGFSPAGVVYVDAELQGDAQPSPGVGVALVPKSERAMQGDSNGLFPLAVRLPLLLLAVVLVVWLRVSWGPWQAWLVGVPLILSCLWLVSLAVMQLLPNLL